MGARLPEPQLQQPAPADPSAQPIQGDESQMAQLVTGVSDGITAVTEVLMNVSPQHGQRMGNVLEEFQAIMLEMSGQGSGGQPPQPEPQGQQMVAPAGAQPMSPV